MIRNRLHTELQKQLPAYVNGTISPVPKLLVWLWLKINEEARDDLTRLGSLRSFITDQSNHDVPAQLFSQIHKRLPDYSIRRTPASIPIRSLITIVIAIVVSLILVWFLLPPGINLRWTVKQGTPISFHVYRAPAVDEVQTSSDSFYLIKEVEADPGSKEYGYFDLLLLPGESYIYRLEAVDAEGRVVSQSTIGHGRQALPGQLALLTVIVLALVNVWIFSRQMRPSSHLNFG